MIYRSPWPSFEIPDAPLTDRVLARALERGTRAALVDAVTGRTITYAELPSLVERIAAGMTTLGVRKGDVVCIFSGNTIDFLPAFLAVARLGAVTTTVNPQATQGDLARQLADSKARFLITTAALEPTWRPSAGTFERVVVFDRDAVPSGCLPFATLANDRGTPPEVSIAPEDLVALPYSSGTTGLPKGVMLTHRNLVAQIRQVEGTAHARDGEDISVVFLPFFHIYGLVAIGLVGLSSGLTMVVMPRFDLDTYLDLVERHRATLLHVVPPVVVAFGKHPSIAHRDYASVRKLFSAAAPLAAETSDRCVKRIGCVLQQGYGLTETSPATHVAFEDPSMSKAGSIGHPVPNTECRIVDPATREDVTPGRDGEIWIRGPQVMRGYLNRPDATAEMIDADGWLHTGDIGHADEGGHFFIVDRLKELIKYKGLQVAPAELEALLLQHPAIADAAVVGFPDAEAGEIPRAFVVTRSPLTADALMAWVAERVAPYKKIRKVDFIEAIPKSPSGKILRRLLRDGTAALAEG